MKSVFETSTGLDAHMILNILMQEGISGRVEGEYLQGGIGELQAMNFIRVLVADNDYDRARQVIQAWEAIEPELENVKQEALPPNSTMYFVIGVIAGAVIMYWQLNV